jgi:choloylglycine hydrolase
VRTRIRWPWSLVVALVLAVAVAGPAAASTGIVLKAADGSVVRGRTMEFAEPLDSDVILIPRGLAMRGITPDGKEEGLAWTTTYAAAGANGEGLPVLIDGLNEKGLGGGIFYFRGFAEFEPVAAADRARTIAPWQVLNWALTQYATVEEVEAALPTIRVGSAVLDALGGVPPVHYFFADATGASIAVEYVAGELRIHDAPLGVITNAPTFDWHMINLSNYLNVSKEPTDGIVLEGVNLDPSSTGGNLLGLPGDFSSASRFVRATAFVAMTPQQATGEDAIWEGFHILDQFDIPLGAVPEPKGTTPPDEITEWTTMSDLKALRFYIWTIDNRDVRVLDLASLPLDGDAIVTYELDQEQTLIDVAAS